MESSTLLHIHGTYRQLGVGTNSGQFIIIIYPYIYLIPFKSKCICAVSIRVLYGNLKQKRLIYSYFIIIFICWLSNLTKFFVWCSIRFASTGFALSVHLSMPYMLCFFHVQVLTLLCTCTYTSWRWALSF